MKIPAQRGAEVGSITVDALNPVFQNVSPTDKGQTFRDLQGIAAGVASLNSQIAQKRDRVALRQAEAEWNTFEQQVADPQSGLYTAQGLDANGLTDRYSEMAAAKREEILSNFSTVTGSGRNAMEQLMEGRTQAGWNRAAGHESAQLDAAEQGQIAASIERATDRASTFWNDDGEFNSALLTAETAARDLAEGQTPEAVTEAVQAETSKIVAARADRLLQNAPYQVEEFLQEQVDAGNMDQTYADQWLDQNDGNIIANKARILSDTSVATSTPAFQVGDPQRGTPVTSFVNRMIGSESSGRPDASVTIDDGRTFSGLGGVGEGRLADMQAAGVVPAGMTLAEFSTAENADLQRAALDWHIKDIDRAIDATGALNRGYSRDGLRAVAHLGGQGGMRRFINSGGRYNPDDSYVQPNGERTAGTSLTDYYNKFSGTSAGGMTADERIAQETDPRVRAAAFEALDGERQRQYRADERLSNQVATAIITDYETSVRDGAPFDLAQALAADGVVEALGTKIETVRDWVQRQEKGVDIETQTTAIQTIERQIQEDPQAFVDGNLIAQYGDQLSNGDMKSYLREQTRMDAELRKPPTEVEEWSRSAVNTLVTDVAVAADIDDKVIQNRLLQQAMMVARTHAANNNGAKISDGQLYATVRQLATETTVANFDPAGLFGDDDQKKGADFQTVLQAADSQDISEFLDGQVDLELTYTTPSGPVNHKVTPEEFKLVYDGLFRLNRAAPSPSEVITLLQLYPPEDVGNN